MIHVKPSYSVYAGPQGRRAVRLRRGAPGFFHFRKGEPGTVVKCGDVPREVAEHPNATWVHVAVYGEWKGHPAGEFAFTRETFAQMQSNFERRVTPVAFKYEHPEYGDGQPKPSAGKVYDVRVDDAGLWAFTLFTDRAAEHIRAAEYTYCSGVFVFDAVDERSGESIGAELLEVGLTDSPFIDGLTPITLS